MKTLMKLIVGTFALVLSNSLFADDRSLTFSVSPQAFVATSTPFIPSLFESPVFDVLNKAATSTPMLLESSKTIQHEQSDDKEVDWIIVRFKSGAGIRMRDNVLEQVDLPDKARLDDAKKMEIETNLHNLKQSLQLHKRSIERYLKGIPEAEVDWMQKEGERRSKTMLQNLNDYYRISYEKGARYGSVKALLKSLADNPIIDISYTDAISNYVPITYETGQPIHDGYLDDGVNAEAAWNVYTAESPELGAAARGSEISVGIIEDAWVKSHVDFSDNLILGFDVFSDNPTEQQQIIDAYNIYTENPLPANNAIHGNGSAGILLAKDNGIGATGIVPEASFALQSTNLGFAHTSTCGAA